MGQWAVDCMPWMKNIEIWTKTHSFGLLIGFNNLSVTLKPEG